MLCLLAGIHRVPSEDLRIVLFWATKALEPYTAEQLLDRYLELKPLTMAAIAISSHQVWGVIELAEDLESDPYRGARMPLF